MKILQFVLVVTVITTTVAFPTPQEVKQVSEAKEQDENVPMVQKIEISVEVKGIPSDVKIPAMVTVTEVKEHLEKSNDMITSVDAKKDLEVMKLPEVKSSESVESSELTRSIEVSKSVEPSKPLVDNKDAETVKKVPNVDDSTTKTINVEQETQAKSETDKQVEATSEPEVKSGKLENGNVEVKADAAEPVMLEAKAAETVKPQARNDSDEEKSSEEASTTEMVQKLTEEAVRSSPVITFDEAVKETTTGSIKEQEPTVVPEVQANANKQVKVDKEVESQPEAKSILDEKVVPIVEDLPMVKQSVETEPQYRTIPVAVVHDEPLKEEIKEAAVKVVETVKVVDTDNENIPAVNPTEAAKVNSDLEKPKAQTELASTTTGEIQKVDALIVQKDDTVKTVDDVMTIDAIPADTVEVKSEKSEEPNVLVVKPMKAVEVMELQPTIQAAAELAKETEFETTKAGKEEGSSTKAVQSESEKAEKHTEDSSISRSAAVKLTEDVTKASEVTEQTVEVTPEESTISTTTTTTAAPVKVEGKKGKKKLPANIRGYSKRLQQDQRKAH